MNGKDTYKNDLGKNNLPAASRLNPFIVPDNFFEQQEQDILNRIFIEKLAHADFDKEYAVPADYFSTLEDNILRKISELKLKEKIQDEGFNTPQNYFNELNANIQDKIFLEKLENDNSEKEAFEIPTHYFEQLNNAITDKIAEERLKSLIQADGFTVPETYFENLENVIKDKIVVHELLDNNINESFSVPPAYFNSLENRIFDRIKQEDNKKDNGTPIITLRNRKINWVKYSAAAVLFFGIGTYFSFNSDRLFQNITNNNHVASVNLQGVSDEELINYLAQVSDDDADLLDLTQIIEDKTGEPISLGSDVKDDEIKEYLNYML